MSWHYKSPDRRFIDNLLRHHREEQALPLAGESETPSPVSLAHENVRGPGYYN